MDSYEFDSVGLISPVKAVKWSWLAVHQVGLSPNPAKPSTIDCNPAPHQIGSQRGFFQSKNLVVKLQWRAVILDLMVDGNFCLKQQTNPK